MERAFTKKQYDNAMKSCKTALHNRMATHGRKEWDESDRHFYCAEFDRHMREIGARSAA
jgi:hypothetical protein